MRQGPGSNEDYHTLYKAGWNAAIKAIAEACDEQVNRSSKHMDRGGVYAEIAAHIRLLEKPL